MNRKNNRIATQLKALSEMSYGKYSDTCLRDVPYNIYDEKTHRGVLRNIFIRCFDENAVLCLVANSKEKIKNAEVLFDKLKKYNVTGIIQNINTKKSNTLLGDENITLCGNEYVFANIGDLKFKISPNSFFRLIQSKRKNFIQLPKNMPV